MIYEFNLIGQKYGQLEVIGKSKCVNGNQYWFCTCNCGRNVTVKYSDLALSIKLDCGCKHRKTRKIKSIFDK